MIQRFVTLVGALALVSSLSSCSLKPETESFNSRRGEIKKVADPRTIQFVGTVKKDEFNDSASGNDVPVNGGQVVVMEPAEPNSLNAYTDSDGYSAEINGYIYNSLLRQDPETFKWEGSLAERWTEEDIVVRKNGGLIRGIAMESNGTVSVKTESGVVSLPKSETADIRKGVAFTFYLRKGVKFHDGQPFTSADVKFSYETMRNEYVDAPSLRNYYKDLETCEVVDDYTVRLIYSRQYWMAREFAGGFSVIPRHIYNPDGLLEKDPKAFGKRFNESPENRKPIGTGQYVFEKWETGNRIVLRRNDDYFDVPHRGHLDRIVFKFISDPVASLQALKNGEIDYLPSVTAEQYEKETDSPDFKRRFVKVEYYTGNYNYIGWNMRRPPFNDQKVRLAMAYGALDRQKFLDTVMYGHGVIVTGSQYYFGPGYDHSITPHPYDPEKAKQLLLEDGWYDRDGDGLRDKDGKPFRFELLLPSGKEIYRQRAALMKENLRKLGIDMTVRELEWATFLENINDLKFEACNLAWGLPIESDPYQLWHTSQRENRGSNYVGFGNAESDHIIEESRLAIDDNKRRELFFQLHKIQHETQPYLFLFTSPGFAVYDKRYRGVKVYKVRPGFDFSEWYIPQGNSTT